MGAAALWQVVKLAGVESPAVGSEIADRVLSDTLQLATHEPSLSRDHDPARLAGFETGNH